MKKAALLLLILLTTYNLLASWPQFTISNDPEICWQQYETANFDIIYAQGLDSLAMTAGYWAEKCYASLQIDLNVKFSSKYKIFIAETDNFTSRISQTLVYDFFAIGIDQVAVKSRLEHSIRQKMQQALQFEQTKSSKNLLVSYSGIARDIMKNVSTNPTARPKLEFETNQNNDSGTTALLQKTSDIFDYSKADNSAFAGSYHSLTGIKPLAILPFPYPHQGEKITGGIVAMLADPLFTHQLGVAAAYNPATPARPQYSLGYVNHQTIFDLAFFTADLETFQLDYADEIIYQNNSFTTLSIGLPFRSAESEYTSHYLSAGYTRQQKKILNHADFLPENNDHILNNQLPSPIDYRSANLFAEYSWKYLKPYLKQGLNPVEGYGFRLKYGYENTFLHSDYNNHSLRSDFFYLYPLGSKTGLTESLSLYFFSGFRMIEGELPAQNIAGVDRYSTKTVGGLLPLVVEDTRLYFVRGNRKHLTGNRLWSSTAELYLPLTGRSGLALKNLNSAQFGIAGFIDYGTVWQNDFSAANNFYQAASTGLEIKTILDILDEVVIYGGSAISLFGSGEKPNFYAGIRLILPF